MLRKLGVVGAVLAASVALAGPASASQQGLTGTLTKDQVSWYGTGRTVTVSGSNIYVEKTDGPAIDVKWYKCSDRNNSGGWVGFPNADPTGRLRIGTGFASGTTFCLAALDHGTNATDTWTGTVWWNVFS